MIDNWHDSEHYRIDPLPQVEPALLNSVDIMRYVKSGCLIDEEDFDQSHLKTASYELRFLGHLYHWEHKQGEGLKPRCEGVTQNRCVTIPKNSITYLWTKECLYLPEYIAARFNLHIRHVHRGILLGTGPLVDPGFGGRILIPLHNLTDNDYELIGGDGIVWVEFTKISKHRYWTPRSNVSRGGLVEFPTEKIVSRAHDYFDKARVTSSGGVSSAFRGALSQAREAAEKAQQHAAQLKKLAFAQFAIGVVGVLALLFAIWQGSVDILDRTVDRVQRAYITQLTEQARQHREQIDELTRQVDDLRAEVEGMKIRSMAERAGTYGSLDDRSS